MPYYTREMVRWMRTQEILARRREVENPSSFGKPAEGKGGGGPNGEEEKGVTTGKSNPAFNMNTSPLFDEKGPKGRVLRYTPSHIDSDAALAISKFEKPPGAETKALNFDERRLKYMRNLLRLQVERIGRIEGTIPSSAKEWQMYIFEKREPTQTTEQYTMYSAKNLQHPSCLMVVKVYERGVASFPNPLYLKFLRHLGKKHPFILPTWEIFLTEQDHVYIFQEYANRADVATFLARKNTVNEENTCQWAHQLYKALDYLGDMAICHHNITPRNILLNHKTLSICLSGFHNSIVYWDPKKEDIAYIPCLPVSSKNRSDTPDFRAPEVYGNCAQEEFDPIQADVWSYAAVIYFMASNGGYPYNWKKDNPKIEEEIADNVQTLKVSDEAKSCIQGLLTTNAAGRLSFDKIGNNPWFGKLKRENVVSSLRKVT